MVERLRNQFLLTCRIHQNSSFESCIMRCTDEISGIGCNVNWGKDTSCCSSSSKRLWYKLCLHNYLSTLLAMSPPEMHCLEVGRVILGESSIQLSRLLVN